jgi:hypothetical protein
LVKYLANMLRNVALGINIYSLSTNIVIQWKARRTFVPLAVGLENFLTSVQKMYR